jgi:hypothetical protein
MARMVECDSTVDIQPAKRRTFRVRTRPTEPVRWSFGISASGPLGPILVRGEVSMTEAMSSRANDVPRTPQLALERWRTPPATSLVRDAGGALAMVVWRLLEWADRRANGQVGRGRLGHGGR